MARYAIIDKATHEVVNVVEWNGNEAWKPGDGVLVVRSDVAAPGWIHDPETGDIMPPVDGGPE